MDTALLTLDILICTVADRIDRTVGMLLPQRQGVRYIISVQYESEPPALPCALQSRTDVTISLLQGMGLSRNRNNAILMSTAQICLIADDDNLYKPEYVDRIFDTWIKNPDADIITFQAQTYQGKPLHTYPAPYICSQEITLRRESILSSNILFDERFGLGSRYLCAGEEDVFIFDARKAGLKIKYEPQVIVQTDKDTTGIRFLTDKKVQITRGATFRYLHGTFGAVLRCFKDAGWYLVHKGANPFPILQNMLKGIWIYP